MPIINTQDAEGKPNGHLIPIWNATQDTWRPDQVYCTTVLPGMSKGPHLHLKRFGHFHCVKGCADLIMRTPKGRYLRVTLSPNGMTYPVPPGYAAEIRCVGLEPAYILNLCSPAWSKDDPDDHAVTDWNPEGL